MASCLFVLTQSDKCAKLDKEVDLAEVWKIYHSRLLSYQAYVPVNLIMSNAKGKKEELVINPLKHKIFRYLYNGDNQQKTSIYMCFAS